MIYVQENNFSRQLALIEYLAKSTNCLFCAWLYPESEVTNIAGLKILDSPKGMVPVTTYGDGVIPRRTELSPMLSLAPHELEFRKNCDSLALYSPDENYWLAAIIGHEGMCLVRDETWLGQLEAAGFNASKEAPGWW